MRRKKKQWQFNFNVYVFEEIKKEMKEKMIAQN